MGHHLETCKGLRDRYPLGSINEAVNCNNEGRLLQLVCYDGTVEGFKESFVIGADEGFVFWCKGYPDGKCVGDSVKVTVGSINGNSDSYHVEEPVGDSTVGVMKGVSLGH